MKQLTRLALPIRALAWATAVCAAVTIAGALQGDTRARVSRYEDDLARALAPELTGEAVDIAWSFPFRPTRATINIQIDAAEIAAAEALDTRPIFLSRERLMDRYVRATVEAQAESTFTDRLVREFRRIRNQRRLDGDAYLELMVAAVQSIPYGDTGMDPLLAPQVCAAGSGICTDKSLLLASLLVREGYDTVIWVFTTQRHVAVGVRSGSADFRGTGYAFIETTGKRFVGQTSPEYLAPGPAAAPPIQIALGGSRPYTAGDEVAVILAEVRRLQGIRTAYGPYVSFARNALRHKERYARRAMETWVAKGRMTFIMTNTHDRPGVYALLARSQEPPGRP
jgi:hypothetical protein